MKYMHTLKMAHRDLKPENILMESEDQSNFSVKVADLGFACLINPKGMTDSLGTLPYMAPELLKDEPYNELVDVWSIGCIFAELLGTMVVGARSPLFEGHSCFPLSPTHGSRGGRYYTTLRNIVINKHFRKA